MTVETDTTGNNVGPDLTQYEWEYCPIGSSHDGYDFRLYNYEKEVTVEVYPENDDPEQGYNVVVREFEIINEDERDERLESGYPVFDLQTHGGWFMEMLSALATAISWVEGNR